ncbi:TIR domain-containing protein [Streptomyces sp. A30]|uniref:TIR domain-containing protein n=1 Tax=Streptomyces sp. A30 TaxID=2789273 RepID=UPI00397FBCB5
MSDSELWFFTSYSELDPFRPAVERFHDDVRNEVHAQLGKQTPGDAFLDRASIELSNQWRSELQHGVCRTKTMLALYSASYFLSEPCAREWTAFAERRRRHREGGGPDEHLLGLAWRRGPMPWPEVVEEDQYLVGDFGSEYERHGLFHLVPAVGQPGKDEYWEIVRKVATRLAAVVYKEGGLPTLDVVEAWDLTPQFGPGLLHPVQVVVVYADLASDTEWGLWAVQELRQARYGVETEVVSATAPGGVLRIRQALHRANRVLVLVSHSFFAHGDMSADALDQALSDGSRDWERLIPVFVDRPEPHQLPTSFRQFSSLGLNNLDAESARAELVRSARALAQTSGRPVGTGARFPGARAAGAGFPGDGGFPGAGGFPGGGGIPRGGGIPGGGAASASANPVQRKTLLVNALRNADSISDEVIRPIWLRLTGIDIGPDVAGLPILPLLFELIDRSMAQTGDCMALVDALDALEPDSQAAQQVRRIAERLRTPETPGPPSSPSYGSSPAPPQPAPGSA